MMIVEPGGTPVNPSPPEMQEIWTFFWNAKQPVSFLWRFLRPTGFRRVLRNFAAPFLGQLPRPSWSALLTSETTKSNGRWILAGIVRYIIFGRFGLGLLILGSRFVYDGLGEPVEISGLFT